MESKIKELMSLERLEELHADGYELVGSYLSGEGTGPDRFNTIPEGRQINYDLTGPLFLLGVFFPRGVGFYKKS